MPAADVIEEAIVGLADHGIDRHDALVAGLAERPFDRARHTLRNRQRVGQDNRRFDLAEFFDLGGTGELAEAVTERETGRNLVLEEIARVRQDRRHTGAYASALDQREMAYRDAGDIRDRVQRARLQHAGTDADVARKGARWGLRPGLRRGARRGRRVQSRRLRRVLLPDWFRSGGRIPVCALRQRERWRHRQQCAEKTAAVSQQSRGLLACAHALFSPLAWTSQDKALPSLPR